MHKLPPTPVVNSGHNRLEAIANLALIVAALAIGIVLLTRYVKSAAIPTSPAAGDQLPNIDGVEWKAHRRTLVLALNTGCHACVESIPYYQRLMQPLLLGRDIGIVAVFPNQPDLVRQFVDEKKLPVASIGGVRLDRLGIDITPTIILVDSAGRVEKTWAGILRPREQADLEEELLGQH